MLAASRDSETRRLPLLVQRRVQDVQAGWKIVLLFQWFSKPVPHHLSASVHLGGPLRRHAHGVQR